MLEEDDRQEAPDRAAAQAAGEEAASIVDGFRNLIENGRTYAEAEAAFQKTRLAYVGRQAKWIAILAGSCILLAALAAVAFVLGAILVLTPYFTALGATVLVVSALVVCAAAAGLLAKARLRALIHAFDAEQE